MKKIIKTCSMIQIAFIVLLLPINALAYNLSKLQPDGLKKIADNIISYLVANNIIEGHPELSSVKNHTYDQGETFKATIIATENPSLIIKVFNDDELGRESYESESQDIERVTLLSQDPENLNKKYNFDIPNLIKYYKSLILPEGNGVIVMEKAPGQSLESIINNFKNMSEEEIAETFERIANQYSNLMMLYRIEKGNEYLYFGDSSLSNIYFDNETEKSYWIDLLTEENGIKMRKRPNINNINFYFHGLFLNSLQNLLTEPIGEYIYPEIQATYPSAIEKLSCAEMPAIVEIIKKRLTAFASVNKGIFTAFQKLNKPEFSNINANEIKKNFENELDLQQRMLSRNISKINQIILEKNCEPKIQEIKIPERGW